MAVPRAQLGGPFGGGSIVPVRHLDVAPILDSILGGTSTLMHQAYLRRVAQRQYEYVLAKLQQEGELRRATMEMTGAYHQAMIGAAQQRIAAKPAAVVQAQRTAAGSLAKEFPDHHLVQRDDAGNVLPYDPSDPADFVGALRTARTTKASADKEKQALKDRLDFMNQSATVHEGIAKRAAAARIAATGTKPLTPAQKQAQDNKDRDQFVESIAGASKGNWDTAQQHLAAPLVLAEAERLGLANDVGMLRIRSAVGKIGDPQAAKDAAAARAALGKPVPTQEQIDAAKGTVEKTKPPFTADPAAVPPVGTVPSSVRQSDIPAPAPGAPLTRNTPRPVPIKLLPVPPAAATGTVPSAPTTTLPSPLVTPQTSIVAQPAMPAPLRRPGQLTPIVSTTARTPPPLVMPAPSAADSALALLVHQRIQASGGKLDLGHALAAPSVTPGAKALLQAMPEYATDPAAKPVIPPPKPEDEQGAF